MGSVNKAQGTPISGNLFQQRPIKKAAETQISQPIEIVKSETKELGRDFLTSPYAVMGVQISQPRGVETAARCLDNTAAVNDFAAFQGGNFALQNPQQAAADLASLGKTVEYMRNADVERIAEHIQQFV